MRPLSKWTGRIFRTGIVPEGADRRALPRLFKVVLRARDRLALSGWLPGRPAFSAVAICLALVGAGTLFSSSDSANYALASMTSRMGLKIREIRINGIKEIRREHVKAELMIGDDTSIVTYDVHAAWERLYELAWVGKVAITKIYPDTIAVEIEERKPFAVWQEAGKFYIIEKNGKIIIPYEPEFDHLPVVVGKNANNKAAELVALISRFRVVADKARAYVLIADRRWDIILNNGVTVKLPQDNPLMALERFSALENSEKLSERELTVVDMRLPEKLVLRLSKEGLAHRKAKAGGKAREGGSI